MPLAIVWIFVHTHDPGTREYLFIYWFAVFDRSFPEGKAA